MPKKETITNTIADLRQRAGITQEELATAVQVTRQTIIAIEKNNYVPSVLLALKLAHYFHKTVDHIFSITYEK